jgi:hypothetical protein
VRDETRGVDLSRLHSIAVSTPRPPVSAMTFFAASSPRASMVSVAPNRLAISRRFLSGSIMMMDAGE